MRIQELLNEFAPPGNDDDSSEPNEEQILRKLAAEWWNGDEQQMTRVERTLAAMGWEIGQVESGEEDAGVFLVRAGDINGDSYIAFNHSDLTLDEVVQQEIVNQQKFHHEYHDAQGLLWSAVSTGEFDLVVDVRDHNHSIIAYATFEVNPNENSISSSDTWVSDRYRRQGIASKMYNWAQELGNTVVKSGTLLPKGKKFWAAREKSVKEALEPESEINYFRGVELLPKSPTDITNRATRADTLTHSDWANFNGIPDPDEPIDKSRLVMVIRKLLASNILTNEEKKLIYYTFWEEMDPNEISKFIKRSPDTISRIIARALRKIKRHNLVDKYNLRQFNTVEQKNL